MRFLPKRNTGPGLIQDYEFHAFNMHPLSCSILSLRTMLFLSLFPWAQYLLFEDSGGGSTMSIVHIS